MTRAALAIGLLALCILAGCGGGGGGNEAAAPGAPVPPPAVPSPPPPSSPSEDPREGVLDPVRAPARNFDLAHWKLTLPSGLEVKTPELNADYQLSGVFYTDPETGGMVFRTPNLAGTTANSRFSRTELREVLAPSMPGQSPENHWTPERGGVMRATLRIDHVSTTGDPKMVGRLIVGQIHGPTTTEVVRLYYEKKPADATGRVYAAMEGMDGTTTRATILGNTGGGGIALGERFRYELALQGLALSVTVTGADGEQGTLRREIDPAYAGQGLYFKAGVYNQNNTGEATDYAQATFFALTHTH